MSSTTADAALPKLAGHVTVSAVGADNLRALRMDTPAEQRRLMLLVGRNGIGKSSYARLFQLLKQSAGPIREPVLWWTENEVDFGDFKKALRRGAEEMTFTFGFTDPDATRWQVCSSLRATDVGGRVHRVELRQNDARFTLIFRDSGAIGRIEGSFDGDTFAADNEDTSRLLPAFVTEPSRLFGIPDDPEDPGTVMAMLGSAFNEVGTGSYIRRLARSLRWQTDATLLESFEGHPFSANLLYRQSVEALKNNASQIRAIREARFCWWAIERLRQAEALVEELARRSAYLGPFRAVPARGYRPSGSAVEQVDSRGGNLALFLVALTDAERRNLNEYLARTLGFRVFTRPSGGQWELQVELAAGEVYDLLDVGFGYSQVLPVAVQLWASGQVLSTSRTKERVATLVIEQPELHLHPHQQVLVARALAACASADQGPVQIVETHSDHLIGEIGMLIARGHLAAERVGVLCMEPHPEGGTRVRTATFDDDGILHNWPTGFMSP